MIQSTVLRRFARNSCVLAAIVCLVMLGIEVGSGASGRSLGNSNALAAAPGTAPNGSVVLSPASGPLSGPVAIRPDPAPAFCPGDSVAGYRWQAFISAAANDPATFDYDSTGPTVPGGGVAPSFPLVSATGINQVNRNTAADTGVGGLITPIPSFNLSVYGALLPDGDYSIGFACSLATETVRFWTTRITVAAGSYSTSTPTTTTTTSTTSTTSTTVAGSTTTTTVPGSTTTSTVAGGTTTTVAGATTTTTVAAGSTATITPAAPSAGGSYSVSFGRCQVGETITFSQPQSTPVTATATCAAPAAPGATGTASASLTAPTESGSYTVTMTGTVSAQRTATFVIAGSATPPIGGSNTGGASAGGSPTFGSTGTIPATGSSTTSVIVWGVLLLLFGRMAILLGRKTKVRPVGS